MPETDVTRRRLRFLELHGQRPLVMGNAWDAGSARLLEAMGFQALATTSSGCALRAGKLDYGLDLDASIAIAAEIAAAVDVPVSVDFEDGFGVGPSEVAASFERLAATGVAGASIEDYTRRADTPIYPIDQAVARVEAAVAAAHALEAPVVVTARTEILTNRGPGLDRETALAQVIDRLQRYQAVGADVLFAPGLREPAEIASVVQAVDRPVSIMAMPEVPSVAALGDLGVARVSTAGWLTYAAMEGARAAAAEVLENGTFGFASELGAIRGLVAEAFGS